jgi:hypothetical protein
MKGFLKVLKRRLTEGLTESKHAFALMRSHILHVDQEVVGDDPPTQPPPRLQLNIFKIIKFSHFFPPAQILHVEQEVVGDDTTVMEAVLACDNERGALLAEEKELLSALNKARRFDGTLPQACSDLACLLDIHHPILVPSNRPVQPCRT